MTQREKRLRSGVFLPEDYRWYIMTDHFHNLRKRTIRFYRGKCQRCGKDTNRTRKSVVHHKWKSYKRLFKERIGIDVILWCKWCHVEWHRDNAKRWKELRTKENAINLNLGDFKMSNEFGELSKDDLTQALGSFDEKLKSLERKILPAGEYTLVFKDWTPRRTQSGDIRVSATLEAVDCADPDLNGAVVFNSCPISGKGEVFLTRMLVAYGITWSDNSLKLNDALNGCIGKTARGIVEPNEYGEEGNKKVSNNVTKWLSGEDVLLRR